MMERKAWENLAAARTLLQGEEPCPNAAASRAYYAAYHACWVAMVEAGNEPPEVRPGSVYFPHAEALEAADTLVRRLLGEEMDA
jgi:hypothetical protein